MVIHNPKVAGSSPAPATKHLFTVSNLQTFKLTAPRTRGLTIEVCGNVLSKVKRRTIFRTQRESDGFCSPPQSLPAHSPAFKESNLFDALKFVLVGGRGDVVEHKAVPLPKFYL